METKMIQVKYYFKEHPKTSLSVFLKTEEQVKASKKNTLITSMSDSKNYNDFDELYEDFMESGSEEWLLPEVWSEGRTGQGNACTPPFLLIGYASLTG